MMLLPDHLRELWKEVEAGRMTAKQCSQIQEQEIAVYRSEWSEALIESGETDLRTSLLREMVAYYDLPDLAEAERRCAAAVDTLRHEWVEAVDTQQSTSVDEFYESPTTAYELMEWHSLRDDVSPLAYVLGLKIARERRVQTCLDFGSGVGSGALLFARAGVAMSLADVSSTLLNFARWRLERRHLSAQFIDLKKDVLPATAFDMVLALDVFEHLLDPIEAVERLWGTLRPGGLLFARIHAEEDAERPQHIVRDFEPTFARMRELGFVEVWRDSWLWGHQLFEKRVTK